MLLNLEELILHHYQDKASKYLKTSEKKLSSKEKMVE